MAGAQESTRDDDQGAELRIGPAIQGAATHYGAGYQGSRMGCAGAGSYDTANPRILAVAPHHYEPRPGYEHWPCGTMFEITGPCGTSACTLVTPRTDSCPGCAPSTIDLSEAGLQRVCGSASGVCSVTIRRIE